MDTPVDFSARGPHAVGLRSVELADPPRTRPLPIDLWYPAAEGGTADEEAPHPFGQPHAAIPDAPPLPGRHPLVVFSHGNSGLRRQSTFLTTHLASWGIAVVAPDHLGNTFPEMAALRSQEERRAVHFAVRRERPADALTALEAALDGRFEGPGLDAGRIAALGHSFGGWTASKLPALEARLRAVCMLAPASEPFVGRKAYAAGELPFPQPIPTLLVAGIDDVLVDLETSIRPLFARLGAPSRLIGVAGADHFHFCDGIPLLHGLHEQNPRNGQPRPTKPYTETLSEARMHGLLRGIVTWFFARSLAGDPDPFRDLDAAALGALDPAVGIL